MDVPIHLDDHAYILSGIALGELPASVASGGGVIAAV